MRGMFLRFGIGLILAQPRGASPPARRSFDDSPRDSRNGRAAWRVVRYRSRRRGKSVLGDLAVTAIAWGALGDMPEYRFWFQVFDCLQGGSGSSEPELMMVKARQSSFH